MGSCNIAQNEIGGKDILIKKCLELTASATITTTALNFTTPHKLVVGDVIKFQSVGTNTVINTNDLYVVLTVTDTDTVTIAETPGGTAITFDAALTAVLIDGFRNLSGARSKSLEFSSDGIDITSQDSDQWTKMLDTAGIRSFSFSGDGVYNNGDVFRSARDEAMQNLLQCLMIIDVKTKEAYYGCFKVTFSLEGPHDGEATYSLSGNSSGEIKTYLFPAA